MSTGTQEPAVPVRHVFNHWDDDGTHWLAWCGRYVPASTQPADKVLLVGMRITKNAKGVCKRCAGAWEVA